MRTDEREQRGGSGGTPAVRGALALLLLGVAGGHVGQPGVSDAAEPARSEPEACDQPPTEGLPHVRRLTQPGPPLSVGVAARPYVERWQHRLREAGTPSLREYLDRPTSWRDRLLPILRAHGVPDAFVYLALIESGMDSTAVSSKEAVGLWQITAETALTYGLSVEAGADERRDERRATELAARYLRDLYDQFGSWELAAAAYNAGPARVRRALRRSGAYSFWELAEGRHLPAETREYVPKLLAVVELARELRDLDGRTGGPVLAD